MTTSSVSQTGTSAIGTSQSSTGSSSTAAIASSTTPKYQDFLKILMAEIQNQNPLSPMDTTQSIAQMATFSQVEQQVNSNVKLDSILSQLEVNQAASLVGKTVSDGTSSGTVVSVAIGDGSNTANLDSGKSVTIGPGVTIS